MTYNDLLAEIINKKFSGMPEDRHPIRPEKFQDQPEVSVG